ncbi:MAG: hypothetical protein KF778_10600 [Rhodocyclaceae bacterium]|nr:hypothetical protein [Rhodocyclaceae bacterium]
MDTVERYLNEGLPACALVRLARLARENNGNGQQALDGWQKLRCPLADEPAPLRDALDRLDKGARPTAAELAGAPLLWLAALDAFVHGETLPGDRGADRAVRDGDQTFWLVPRHRPDAGRGYVARQFGNLARWLRYHHVLPAAPAGLMPLRVVAARGNAAAVLDRLARKGELCVALAAFADGVVENVAQCYQGLHFTLSGLAEPGVRLRAAQDALAWARACKADMLIFPELTLPADLRADLCDQLLRESRQSHLHQVGLVMLGSFHEQQPPGKFRNRGELVAADGSLLVAVEKRCAVTFEERAEALDPCDPFEALASPLGLLALAICKDYFDGSVRDMLNLSEPDWIVVPSMSDSMDPHLRQAAEFRRRLGSCTLVANQPMPRTAAVADTFQFFHAEVPGWQSLQIQSLFVQRPSAQVLPLDLKKRPPRAKQ